MIQKKICLLGTFGVGKTSLVRRYVSGEFSDRYLTTVGVKLDRKDVEVDGRVVRMILWDIHGDDEFQRVRASYLRGAAGYLLVVDGTRAESLNVALELHELAVHTVGQVPHVLVINKADLVDQWTVSTGRVEALQQGGWTVLHTSAKSGDNVEAAFRHLANAMVVARADGARDVSPDENA